MERLLTDWEAFARAIPAAAEFDAAKLRDHAEDMLRTVASDLDAPQSEAQQLAKSQGRQPESPGDTAAETHAGGRYTEGFDTNALVSEYRALRATVMRHWLAEARPADTHDVDDLVRFNEAIDQALTESVRRFTRDADRARERLRRQDERLRIAVEAANLGTWEMDLISGECREHSRRHAQLFGYTEADTDWSRESAEQHVVEEDRPAFNEAFARALGTGILETQIRVRWPDGSTHWVAAYGRTRLDGDGNPVTASGVSYDVTDRRSVEEALRESARRKDEFLAVLAHELRNPLAPLSTGLHILRHGRARPELVEQQIPRMERQLAQLVHLVDDLLDASRINRGVIELKRGAVSLPSAVRQALESCSPAIERKGHRLTLNVDSEQLYVNGDRTRLVQVFSNLVNNAAKYTQPNGEIIVTLGADGEDALVSVRDNGPGIPVDVRPRMFEMFAQGVATSTAPREGLGIGLWLAKRLMELHGGSLELVDRPPPGSEFVARLARVPSEGASVSTDWRNRTRTPALRLLVVDDNQDAASSLAEWLSIAGHDVRTVPGGREALHCGSAFIPDAVLLDIGMPEMDGYEVARRIRAEPWGHSVLLVAVTGWGQAEDQRRAHDAGFDAHLTKPPDATRLQTVLERCHSARPG